MERVNRILEHEKYKEYLAKNDEAEAHRCFCHHNMGHFLDVARLAMLLNETESYGIEKELIYGAALLHDIGRWMEYETEMPHEKASVMLSAEILKDCGFGDEEAKCILEAVGSHRNDNIKEEKSLSGLLYRADKLSRPCFACKAEAECGWKQGKKNKKLLL